MKLYHVFHTLDGFGANRTTSPAPKDVPNMVTPVAASLKEVPSAMARLAHGQSERICGDMGSLGSLSTETSSRICLILVIESGVV